MPWPCMHIQFFMFVRVKNLSLNLVTEKRSESVRKKLETYEMGD